MSDCVACRAAKHGAYGLPHTCGSPAPKAMSAKPKVEPMTVGEAISTITEIATANRLDPHYGLSVTIWMTDLHTILEAVAARAATAAVSKERRALYDLWQREDWP